MKTTQATRKVLIARRDSLVQRRVALLDDEQQLLTTREADWEDQAADTSAARVLGALSDSELRELQRIHAALERIERGVYGQCVVCMKRVPTARLRAVPEADRCTTCTSSH